MKRSQHAKARMQQRGFSDIVISLIYFFGEDRPVGAGRVERALTKRAEKQIIQVLGKCSAKALIVAPDGETIVTAYNR